jgi:hypothetical protein
VPATAAVSGLTLTVTNGTSGLSSVGGKSDSSNAATVQIKGFMGANDSLIVTAVLKSVPASSTAVPVFYNLDSATPTLTSSNYKVESNLVTAITVATSAGAFVVAGASNRIGSATTSNTPDTLSATAGFRISPTADANINHTFGLQLDSILSTRVAGTYTYSVVVKTFESMPNVSATPTQTVTAEVSIVIDAATSASLTISPGLSTAFIGTATAATSDAAISALATASTTAAAYVRVNTYNSSSVAKPESITATISGAGVLSFGGISGASLTVAGTGSSDISILPDGRAGTATIAISTTSRVFPAKTMTFYAAAPTKLVATVPTPLLQIGSNSDSVRVTATDATGTLWAGTLYTYAIAAADAAIASAERATVATSATSCSFDTVDQRHECAVTGVSAGTANLRISNYATAALATAAASGAEITADVKVVVSQASVATVKIEFDKASYAPGERARIYVTPLDSTGKAMQVATYSNLFATGGISTASALTFAGSTTTADSLTAVSITTKANSSSTTGARAGSFEYTVYMPVNGGTVTISATGGTTLPIAGRVAVSASATVTDSGAAALAAVSALATTVASLKTLITTLTNLVLKIQKKVKA